MTEYHRSVRAVDSQTRKLLDQITLEGTCCCWNIYHPQTKFAKVMFLQVSVCSQGGGMRGCSREEGGMACMVASGGDAWLLPGGMHGCSPGEPAWDTMRYGDTINERAVRILLECILLFIITSNKRLMPTSPTFVYRKKSCTSTIKLISGCVRITQPPGICRVCSKIGCVYCMG